MEDPGQKLKRARERLNLRYRDVEEASQQIADRHKNPEYYLALSRLADIENRGTVPSIYRLYSLCAIYRLSFDDVLTWYGVQIGAIAADAASVEIRETHLIDIEPRLDADTPVPPTPADDVDLTQTFFLKHQLKKWGKLPLQFLTALDVKRYRYGFIGSDDWSMYPMLAPGALIQIDETRRRIVTSGWSSEQDRPIYFFEHRDGFDCAWCTVGTGVLVLQSNLSSHVPARIYRFPGEVEVIGQVVGVAMRLDLGKRRHTRS